MPHFQSLLKTLSLDIYWVSTANLHLVAIITDVFLVATSGLLLGDIYKEFMWIGTDGSYPVPIGYLVPP